MNGVKTKSFAITTIGAFVFLAAGIYVFLLVAAPMFKEWPAWEKLVEVSTVTPGSRGDRLYIPEIGVDVAIIEGSDMSVLDLGAWHRQPQNGDPQKGGNFVLSAHRFSMGWTPQQSRAKSPFFRINALKVGDQFFVDFKGLRYVYKVARLYDVPRTATEIELPSSKPKLTLYSCGLRGETAGRTVVEAIPLGNG